MTQSRSAPDLILQNGRVTTLDPNRPEASEVAVKDGYIVGVGNTGAFPAGPDTQVIDLHGRRVIPGLNDSHMHPIRGGLNYNMELRWDGVPSLADALRMLKEQAARTPPPQWVRVIGGWTEFQFAERRMPTLDEINAVAPDTPVFVLHLYDRAFLNARGIACRRVHERHAGISRRRDSEGQARESDGAADRTTQRDDSVFHAGQRAEALAAKTRSTRRGSFMRELNRFGITSVIDAGGGFQNYPDDYEVINELHKRGELTVRFAYNLFTQKPKQELADFRAMDTDDEARGGRRFLSDERRGRDARLLRCRFRGLPRTTAGDAARDGGRTQGGHPAPRGESLAVPPPRHLRRDNQPSL